MHSLSTKIRTESALESITPFNLQYYVTKIKLKIQFQIQQINCEMKERSGQKIFLNQFLNKINYTMPCFDFTIVINHTHMHIYI